MAQPYQTYSKSRRKKKKKPLTLKRLLKKTGRFFVSLARYIVRGVYYGVSDAARFIAKLPARTRLIGGGALGTVLLLVVVLLITAPKKDSGGAISANQTELAAAFEQLSEGTVDGALNDTGDMNAVDGYNDLDPVTDEAAFTDETAATEGAGEVAFTQEVRSGDDGPIIAQIQTRLMELGYMDSDEPTEHFGPLTKSALVAFQKHNDLGDDGICGEQTYAALMSEEAKVYVMQMGDSGADVEGVQSRLYELGYMDNKANITGNFGEKTEEAAKLFQKKNDLKADGKVGNKTINMLYDEDAVGNAYSVGDEAPIIKECQQKLYKLGYITSRSNATGVFNNVTRSAIKAFQQSNGLTRDGALGPITRDLLLSNDAQEKSLQMGDSGTDVKNAQQRLVKLNYMTSSNATGYFGALTEDAVRAFQKRNGITVSGVLNSYTLKKLSSSSAKKAASPVSSSSGKGTSSGSSSSASGSSSSSSGSSAAIANASGVEKIVAIAQSKLGCTYVRGAKGPNTFDCSGFVYYCMRSAGLSASYMTSIAWRSTGRYTRISSLNSLSRGDIVVFSGDTASTGHVGIYLGGGKMIDASSSEGKVRQSSSVLSSGGYWSKHFICGYRVF